MPVELSRNCFDVILQHDWSIEQCLLHIRVFFGGKTKESMFWSFHPLAVKTSNEHLPKPFSRSYENRSNTINIAAVTNIPVTAVTIITTIIILIIIITKTVWTCYLLPWAPSKFFMAAPTAVSSWMMRIPLSSVYNSNKKNIEVCHYKYLTMTKGNINSALLWKKLSQMFLRK